jgi:DNA-binding NarL/FixJ family response regulator
VVRTSLRTAFELLDGIEIIGEGANGAEAVNICWEADIEVLLLDLIMPVMDGVTAITNPELLQEAIQAGASICVSKHATLDELYAAINTAFDRRS